MKLVEVSELEFSYHQNQPILNIKDFEINEAERVFLYGPSGCGKSTFLNLIAGVLKASSGCVNLFGQNLSDIGASKRDRIRAQKMGYIFQSFNLIPYLNVIENILLPTMIENHGLSKAEHKELAIQALKRLGLETQIHQKAHTLSIGQQQRVAQARALMGKPQLIIADEPTSSLDQNNTQEFMDFLLEQSLERKIALLFVSHDRRLEHYFDRAVNLMDCNLVGKGSLA
jgi:putative ABC transport system ATP-binding protein